MKKKLLLIIATLVCTLACTFGLAACGEGDQDKSSHTTHTYDQQNTAAQYLKTEADCTHKAVYYYSCACGEKGTGTFEYGEAKGHIFTLEKAESEFLKSEADCIHKAIYYLSCSVCGNASDTQTFENGDFGNHSFTQAKAEAQYLKSEADCTHKAVYYKSCSVCGEKGTETFEHGEPNNHSFITYIYDNNATCVKDGTKTATCEHCTQTNTVTDPEHLKTGHSFTEEKTETEYLKSAATCTEKAVYYKSCSVCEEKGTETFEHGEPKGHNFVNNVCQTCGALDKDLKYTLSDDESYYIVTGVSPFTDSDVFINATYNEKPVKIIGAFAFANCVSLTSITIPDSVTDIGLGAFNDCIALTIYCEAKSQPSGWDSNWNYFCPVVWDCKNNETTVNGNIYAVIDGIRYSLKDGEATVTRQPHNITTASIPAKVIYKSVEYNVTDIGYRSFYNCGLLTSVTIPDSVINIDENVFYGCSSLTNITVDENNTDFKSIDGNLYNKSGKTLMRYAPGKTATSFTIPEEVFYIGKEAFNGCRSFTSMTIPDGIRNIGEGAFNGCSSLESITVPFVGDCIKYVDDGPFRYPFGYIFGTESYAGGTGISQTYYGFTTDWTVSSTYYIPTALKSVTVTGGEILYGAFSGCCSLTSITLPDSVTYIGDSAFQYCNSLTSITIHDGVKSIGDNTFDCCNSLTSITIGNSVANISNFAFQYCSSLTSITIPDSVKSIGNYAFNGCNSLASITIPDSVTYIGQNVFEYCSTLSKIKFNEIASYCPINGLNNLDKSKVYIGEQKLLDMTSIAIPNSVTVIGDYAFIGCDLIESVTVGIKVTNIGNCAFADCTSLTSITIPDSVTSIGLEAFNSCPIEIATIPAIACDCIKNSKLKTVVITGGESIGYRAFADCTSLTSVTIPDSVTKIDWYAFSGCISITSITLPDSVTSIGEDAFNGCPIEIATIPAIACKYINNANLKTVTITSGEWINNSAFYNCNLLTSITIPNCVIDIGNNAFSGCSSLTSITIPNSVTNIYANVFERCFSLANITVDENNDNYKSIAGNLYSKDEKTLIQYAIGKKETSFTLPDSVTSIGWYAFSDCSSLTSITIPDSVTNIYGYAFSGCSSLTSITIPDSVTNIEGYAFSGCSSLTSVTIGNGVTNLYANVFEGCSSLANITVDENNDNYKSIAGNLYSKDEKTLIQYAIGKKETSFALPDSVTNIYGCAFSGCSSLKSITIPDGVKSIGNYAFNGCTSLTSITIPDGVTSIGDNTFDCCNSLTSITIPDSVTNIYVCAFSGCSSLTDITFKGTKEQWIAISKSDSWNSGTGEYTIHCTDGDIVKS